MDQQKQPVAPDTKTAPIVQPAKSDDHGNQKANPANVAQPPVPKDPNAATSAAPKAN